MHSRFFGSARWHQLNLALLEKSGYEIFTLPWHDFAVPFIIQNVEHQEQSFRLVRFATIETSDYLDFPGIYSTNQDFLKELINAAGQFGAHALLLSNLLNGDRFHQAIRSTFPQSMDLPCVSSMGIVCGESFNQYCSTIGKESRKGLRKLARRMEEKEVTFSFRQLTISDLDWVLHFQKLRAEHMGYDPLIDSIVHKLLEEMIPDKRLYSASVLLEEKIMAAQVILEDDASLAMYFQSFDMDYAKLYPALYLLKKLIDHCCENGYTYLDLLRGKEAYKQRFCNHEIRLVKCLIPIDEEPLQSPIIDYAKTLIE